MGPFDAIAFVALCVGLVKIFTGPVAKALAMLSPNTLACSMSA